MSFPWLESQIPPAFHQRVPELRHDMHAREVTARAKLLMRLGRSKSDAAAQCRAYLQWEFDGLAPPSVLREIDALVDRVYARR